MNAEAHHNGRSAAAPGRAFCVLRCAPAGLFLAAVSAAFRWRGLRRGSPGRITEACQKVKPEFNALAERTPSMRRCVQANGGSDSWVRGKIFLHVDVDDRRRERRARAPPRLRGAASSGARWSKVEDIAGSEAE
eukprot:gene38632-10037_t